MSFLIARMFFIKKHAYCLFLLVLLLSCRGQKPIRYLDPWLREFELDFVGEDIRAVQQDVVLIENNNKIPPNIELFNGDIELDGTWRNITSLYGYDPAITLRISKINKNDKSFMIRYSEKMGDRDISLCLRSCKLNNSSLQLNIPLREEWRGSFNKFFIVKIKEIPVIVSSASLNYVVKTHPQKLSLSFNDILEYVYINEKDFKDGMVFGLDE